MTEESAAHGGAGRRWPVALTVAGSDSGGGAGVAADLATFSALGVWGTLAVTAVTAQDTLGVHAVEAVSPALVVAQMEAAAVDIGVEATKTGMLATAEMVSAVAAAVARLGLSPLVVDPVMVSSSGHALLDGGGAAALAAELLPLATVVTPNLAEAAALLGGGEITDRRSMEEAGWALAELGPAAVLVTGGHLGGGGSPDLLVVGGERRWLEADRVEGAGTHGSGCVLSAAVAAGLARGLAVAEACVAAKAFCSGAIANGVALGAGDGAVDPAWAGRG